MTAPELALWIGAAISLQLAAFATIAFRRHWLDFQTLKLRAAEQGIDERSLIPEPAEEAEAPAWTGYRDFRVVHREFEDPGRSVCSFHLAPCDSAPLPPFRPGQFLTFKLDLAEKDAPARPLVRCYSLSDAPSPDHYRVSVKRALPPPEVPDAAPGRSSNFFHDRVQVGDILGVRAPGGHFHLQEGESPAVLVAGGIGITPMLGMLNAGLRAHPDREMWLFYGVRNGDEHAMKAQLVALRKAHRNFHLHVCYSRPRPEDVQGRDYLHRGHADATLLRLTLPLRPFHFYVCGPRSMMETLVPALRDWGVHDSHIHYEAFGPASLARPQPQPAAVPSVGFSKSGKRLAWSGAQSLLEFAEANGIAVDYGCRAGSCGTCAVALESGEVRYTQQHEFDPEPGTCLLCVSQPATDIVLRA